MTCLHVPILATAHPSLNIFHSCLSISLSRRPLFFPVFLPTIPCSTTHLQSCFPQVRTCFCYALKLFSCCFAAQKTKHWSKRRSKKMKGVGGVQLWCQNVLNVELWKKHRISKEIKQQKAKSYSVPVVIRWASKHSLLLAKCWCGLKLPHLCVNSSV